MEHDRDEHVKHVFLHCYLPYQFVMSVPDYPIT